MSCVMCHVLCVICHVSFVICHVSHITYPLSRVTSHLSPVTCHMPPVPCHLSPVTKPTATATDPPPANSPVMYSRLKWKTNIGEETSQELRKAALRVVGCQGVKVWQNSKTQIVKKKITTVTLNKLINLSYKFELQNLSYKTWVT